MHSGMPCTHVYTDVKCQEFGEEEICLAADDKIKGYIRGYWLVISSKWALYARQHSSMLLWGAANACESCHRKLKTSPGVDKGRVANHGMLNLRNSESHWHLLTISWVALHIMRHGRECDKRACETAWKLMSKKLSVCMKRNFLANLEVTCSVIGCG